MHPDVRCDVAEKGLDEVDGGAGLCDKLLDRGSAEETVTGQVARLFLFQVVLECGRQ